MMTEIRINAMAENFDQAGMATQITGWEQVERWLGSIEKELTLGKKQAVVRKAAARIANEAVPDHFLQSRSPAGDSWNPLSAAYREKKLQAKGVETLLFGSGALFRSVRSVVRGMDAFVVAGGPDVPYAAAHNYGYPEGGIPQREFIGIGPAEEAIIGQTLTSWLAGLGRG